MHYPIATIGTVITLVVAFFADRVGIALLKRRDVPWAEKYRERQILGFIISAITVAILVVLWGRLFHNKGTFFGLLAAGLAVALREPLLSIAGRISIFAAHMYAVGDRIEINQMGGDVIGIGFFYTRMLEIGNWMHADQATGRTVLISNSTVYQHPIYNYTQNFSYIWDEIMLPVTYASEVSEATRILLEAGDKFTRSYIDMAKQDVEQMRKSYLVPDVTLEPTVFTRVTSNYVELTMRYIVHPRRRRDTSSLLYSYVFDLVQKHPAITIGSDTMDLTVHPPERKNVDTNQEERMRSWPGCGSSHQ